MAVVDVYAQWSGERVELVKKNGVSNWEGRATRLYTVLVDDPTDGADTVVAGAGVPGLDDAHDAYSDLKAVNVLPAKRGPVLWSVEVQWAGGNDPLNEPYDRRYQSQNVVEAVDRDAAGDLVANAVGDPFTGVQAEVADLVYTVTRNEASFPLATTRTYLNTVSSDSYKGYDAGEAYLRSVSGVYVVVGASYHYRVTYEVVFRVGGWGLRVLNKGPRYLVSAGGAAAVVRDRLGVDEARLDTDGTLLAEASADVWLDFDLYDTNNFTALGLG